MSVSKQIFQEKSTGTGTTLKPPYTEVPKTSQECKTALTSQYKTFSCFLSICLFIFFVFSSFCLLIETMPTAITLRAFMWQHKLMLSKSEQPTFSCSQGLPGSATVCLAISSIDCLVLQSFARQYDNIMSTNSFIWLNRSGMKFMKQSPSKCTWSYFH